jgi:putative endonuclease
LKLPRLLQTGSSSGAKYEQEALRFLKQQGLLFICQNFYCRFGEIDLIMSDQNTLVFIEVRYRKNQDYGGAEASITRQKQKKIIKTAKHYLSQLDYEPYCRFDVVAISEHAAKPEWIQDAFQE